MSQDQSGQISLVQTWRILQKMRGRKWTLLPTMTTTTTLLRHPTFLGCKIKEQHLSLMVLNWYWSWWSRRVIPSSLAKCQLYSNKMKRRRRWKDKVKRLWSFRWLIHSRFFHKKAKVFLTMLFTHKRACNMMRRLEICLKGHGEYLVL